MSEETKDTAEEQVETTETEDTAKEQENTDTAPEKKQDDEKTFTQADLDRIVEDRLARERKKIPSADELKKFNDWKKEQQTEAERQAEREKEFAALQSENAKLKNEAAIIRSGVNSDDVDYVLFKVSQMDGDFEDNLKKFLASNKKYTEAKTTKVEGVKHEQKADKGVTHEQFAKMGYKERLKLKQENPDLYDKLKG